MPAFGTQFLENECNSNIPLIRAELSVRILSVSIINLNMTVILNKGSEISKYQEIFSPLYCKKEHFVSYNAVTWSAVIKKWYPNDIVFHFLHSFGQHDKWFTPFLFRDELFSRNCSILTYFNFHFNSRVIQPSMLDWRHRTVKIQLNLSLW